jgi:hypothetical protein
MENLKVDKLKAILRRLSFLWHKLWFEEESLELWEANKKEMTKPAPRTGNTKEGTNLKAALREEYQLH